MSKSDKIKIALIVIGVCLLAGVGFCVYGYFTQRSLANQGIKEMKNKEYQNAYEKFHEASGKFTLIWTTQKEDTLFYEANALYELEEYQKASKVYDGLIEKKLSKAYTMKALCAMGMKDKEGALEVCAKGIKELPNAGDIYATQYGIYAKSKQYKTGITMLNQGLNRKKLTNRKDVLLARISAYESLLDFNTAYRYAKEYVAAYPKDKEGLKELTFLETRHTS